ncbi:uncharacterized protein LOC142639867 [Castanea sativa]|uniref:uncharacterized protein LOC142639867 n=1 Tax=Castanea sativa TaxID=21020 RepID=UPI003F651FB6
MNWTFFVKTHGLSLLFIEWAFFMKFWPSTLAKAETDRRIKGVSICKGAPTLSNLMFADDSILFCQATIGEVEVINDVLQTYANASGQCINMEKSSVYFSSNTRGSQRDEIVSLLGVKEVKRFESYLGLPTLGWKVSDLIDWDLHGRRRDILIAKFNRDEVEAVYRIPLSRRVVEDSMVWLHNKKGEYTVWSGYHLARQVLKTASRAEVSNRSGWQKAWSALWKLKIPEKIKIFDRRACHDILPTQVNLAKRKIISDTLCHCSFEALVDRLSTTEMELFLVQAWTPRNVVVHGGQMKNPRWLKNRAAELLEDYKKAQASLLISSAAPGSNCWKPPPQDVYKLNFDAAVFLDLNCSRVGAIIRNFAGEVMAGMAAKGEFVHNSDDAEALSCQKALEFAIESRFSNLVIEGDNSNVMRAISTTVPNNSFLGHIMDDIRHFISRRQSVGFSCVRRE